MLLSEPLWEAHKGNLEMLIGIVLKCKAPVWKTKAHDYVFEAHEGSWLG